MKHLGFLVLASTALNLPAIGRGVKGVYVVVTPSGTPLGCRIRSVENPPKVENDLVRFKVVVSGGSGPYEWRLPLYKTNNGFNDVAIARIGKVTLSNDGTFPLDLNIVDLEKTDREELTLTLRSHERFETTCSMPATSLKQIARAVPEKKFIMEGKIVR